MKKYKTIYILIIFILFSCSKDTTSTIPSNVVVIVSSKQDSLYSSPSVYNFFNKKNRYLPMEEDYYKIKWISPSEFEAYKNYPSVIFLNLDIPKDNDSKLYNHIFQNKTDRGINFIENFYAQNQTLIGIESRDVIELETILKEYESKLTEQIDLNLNHLILSNRKKIPANNNIMEYVKNKYDIDIFIDQDYVEVENSNDLLWLARGNPKYNDPWRWIVVRKIDKSKSDNFSIIQDTFEEINSILSADDSYISISNPFTDYLYDEKLLRYEIDFLNDKKLNNNQYLNQIGLDSTKKYSIEDLDIYVDDQTNQRENQILNIINQRKKETYRYKYKENNFVGGTYRHYNIVDNDTIPNVGGPYISCIYNKKNSSILLIGLINNPSGNKMIYLKQMEAIFKDIK